MAVVLFARLGALAGFGRGPFAAFADLVSTTAAPTASTASAPTASEPRPDHVPVASSPAAAYAPPIDDEVEDEEVE
ncbi:MAG: hypothetical protein WCY15_17115, partial [Phenylobacterium sp.]|uniref:hypothetical protein n=1 Tax=Phenylobacterium sp. TaxID=1871053 RepID=UPI00356441BE